MAFSEYGYAVNCYYEIYQVQENADGTAPSDLKSAKEVAPSSEEDEMEQQAKFTESLDALTDAIHSSASNAPLRNTAIFRVPYCDVELVEIK